MKGWGSGPHMTNMISLLRSRGPQRRMQRKLLRFAVAYLSVIALGTLGYVIIEGWRVIEALYMTVITLSTVGFSEVRPLSSAGRLFTSALIVAGVGAVTYLFAAISQYIVSGELTGSIRKARMQQRIDALSEHYIVVGFGRVGQQVVEDLLEAGSRCVVLETHPETLHHLPDGLPHVEGDGTDDEVLERAGIGRASGLVASTGDDATNLFVTLTARTLNPGLTIVARSNHPASESKLRRAGASHVISPYRISGRRIARQLLTPTVTDFLDVVMHSGKLELLLEECTVLPDGRLAGRTVAEAEVRRHTGANVLAIRRRGQDGIVTNLPADLRFEPNDVLIALGTAEQLTQLAGLAGTAG
jgi:voltage-gated potassium channel